MFLAVVLNEPVRAEIESLTAGFRLAAPGCIAWEIGNALYGALKRNRIDVDGAIEVFKEFQGIPVRVLDVNIEASIRMAAENRIPTYDAYYLQCALDGRRPLLTLDRRMTIVAAGLGLKTLGDGYS